MVQEVFSKQVLLGEFHSNDYEVVLVTGGAERQVPAFDLVRLHQGGVLEFVRLDGAGETAEQDFLALSSDHALRVRRRRR